METLGVYEGANDVSVSVSRELRMTRRDTLFPFQTQRHSQALGFCEWPDRSEAIISDTCALRWLSDKWNNGPQGIDFPLSPDPLAHFPLHLAVYSEPSRPILSVLLYVVAR